MRKEQAKDIAKALVFTSGFNFDGEAFLDCDLSESDITKIINEIHVLCGNMLNKVNEKYKTDVGYTTAQIVNSILYEPE